MSSEEVIVEDIGPARWISLNRPDCRNGLTPDVGKRVIDAVRSAHNARVIALTGRNAAFSSGLDLRVAMEAGPELVERAEEHLRDFQGMIHAIVDAPQIVIGIVDGPAVGFGCDLALACDLRIASRRAYFQESFAKIGLVPDGGGTWMLPRLVGLPKALEMVLLADKIPADIAAGLGLVSRVVDDDKLMDEGRALVARIASGPPLAQRHVKRLMRAGLERDFKTSFAAEGRAQIECLRSNDVIEGVTAFFQKRAPEFQGA